MIEGNEILRLFALMEYSNNDMRTRDTSKAPTSARTLQILHINNMSINFKFILACPHFMVDFIAYLNDNF
jgi:hypothetical protein